MGLNMGDFSFAKTTAIKERLSLQFRAEANNALNHTHLGVPNTSPTSSAFGRITATAQPPRTAQFGLKLLF